MIDILSKLPEALAIALIVLLLMTAVLWFFLPFAVFGVKDKIKRLEDQLETTNSVLTGILRELKEKQSIGEHKDEKMD